MAQSKAYRPSVGFVVTAIAVVAVGLSLLIPALRPARAHRAYISCKSNLKMIEIAKRQWVDDADRPVGAQVDTQAVYRLMGEQVRLVCPNGGRYSYGVVSTVLFLWPELSYGAIWETSRTCQVILRIERMRLNMEYLVMRH